MSDIKLPPLPEPTAFLFCKGSEVTARAFGVDEMCAYARAAVQANVPDGWADAYSSFVGAFDNAVARRKDDSEYANDARRRLRAINEAVTSSAPPVAQPAEPSGIPVEDSIAWQAGAFNPLNPKTAVTVEGHAWYRHDHPKVTQAQPVHDAIAYQEAVNLATALFKKHFSHEEHYASGRVVWGPCDTTAGVISQIDNMVCGLVQAQPAERKPQQDKTWDRWICLGCLSSIKGVHTNTCTHRAHGIGD